MSYSTQDVTTYTSLTGQTPADNPDRFIQWLQYRELQRANDLREAQNDILTLIKNRID